MHVRTGLILLSLLPVPDDTRACGGVGSQVACRRTKPLRHCRRQLCPTFNEGTKMDDRGLVPQGTTHSGHRQSHLSWCTQMADGMSSPTNLCDVSLLENILRAGCHQGLSNSSETSQNSSHIQKFTGASGRSPTRFQSVGDPPWGSTGKFFERHQTNTHWSRSFFRAKMMLIEHITTSGGHMGSCSQPRRLSVPRILYNLTVSRVFGVWYSYISMAPLRISEARSERVLAFAWTMASETVYVHG